jgi:hypothetical protein
MEESQSILELHVDQTASKNLSDAARWAKFLSVLGFVCVGFVLIFFIAMRSQITGALSRLIPGFSELDSMGMLIGIIVIIAGLVGLLLYFLFRGSLLIKKGIETKSQDVFNSGLGLLKAYFIMYGIITIVELVSSIVSIL